MTCPDCGTEMLFNGVVPEAEAVAEGRNYKEWLCPDYECGTEILHRQ